MSTPNARDARVLHVNNEAGTTTLLIAEARSRGLSWNYFPKASPTREWTGPRDKTERALRGVGWVGRLAATSRRHDIVQIHSGTTYRHSRYAVRRFVLHCHGSDVRSAQYQPGVGPIIHEALQRAEAVFYATPDLAQHVHPHRPDAHYLPIPIAIHTLPTWQPPERPRIVFASRWQDVKGLECQLDTARALRRELGSDVQLLGLDWGPGADQARAAGVELLPFMDHDEYLAWLAGSTAVVGQAAGILATSELETLGAGIPLLLPVPLPLYADDAPPVLGDSVESVAQAAVGLLESQTFDSRAGHDWIERVHGVARGVDLLLSVYEDVLERRR